jgi:hypothetical protein
MRRIAGLLTVMVLVAAPPPSAWAGDAETIEAINQAAAKLDRAFEQQDAATIKQLMTPDHVAVTPYYDGPQSIDDQIASLPDLKYGQTILGEVAVRVLDPTLAQRSFSAELDGTFMGRPSGAWRCQPFGEIGATTLDFTVPTADKSHAEIGRLDFKLTYDAASKSLRGTATLYFVPLGQDPLAVGELKDGGQFDITGQRVAAP